MGCLCPFLPNEKSIHFPGYTYSECPLCFRPDGERGGGLWARVKGVVCSSVITVPSYFPTHWWIFQSWCDCPSWQRWWFFFPPILFYFFFSHPHTQSALPKCLWSLSIAVKRWVHCNIGLEEKEKKDALIKGGWFKRRRQWKTMSINAWWGVAEMQAGSLCRMMSLRQSGWKSTAHWCVFAPIQAFSSPS